MDGEDPSVQDARCRKLWQVLDTKKEGQLNVNGLKKGLQQLDHRECTLTYRYQASNDPTSALKNAESLLRDVLKAADLNGDGHIEYEGRPCALILVSHPLMPCRIP